MKYFFCKLIPPRGTFAQDMTPEANQGFRFEALPMPRLMMSPVVTE